MGEKRQESRGKSENVEATNLWSIRLRRVKGGETEGKNRGRRGGRKKQRKEGMKDDDW